MQPSSVTDFLANLPPDVNPYLATANMLENSVHSPRSPPWARRLSVATIIFFTIMLLQAVYLVFQKVRVQTPKMKFNKLGLVVFDLSYATGIGFSLTASLTVTVLVLERISDSGHRVRESVIALLFGHQFMPILITAWALSWFGTCQCALAFWNSNAAFNLNRKRLQAFLQWGLSATFLLASFGPINCVYGKRQNRSCLFLDICHSLCEAQAYRIGYPSDHFNPEDGCRALRSQWSKSASYSNDCYASSRARSVTKRFRELPSTLAGNILRCD